MVRQSKRTCALAPRVQDVRAPSAPRDQSVPPVAMFGPAAWCSPYAPQAGTPSSTQWLAGLQHHGVASSSVQAAWWAPAGIGAFANRVPTTDSPGDSDVIPGVDSDPPGGFVNFLKKSTSRPAQVVSNESSSQPINVGDDNNGGDDARTEKRLLWTKEEDLRLVSAWLNNSNDPVQANYKKNDTFWKMLPLFSTAPPPKIGGG